DRPNRPPLAVLLSRPLLKNLLQHPTNRVLMQGTRKNLTTKPVTNNLGLGNLPLVPVRKTLIPTMITTLMKPPIGISLPKNRNPMYHLTRTKFGQVAP